MNALSLKLKPLRDLQCEEENLDEPFMPERQSDLDLAKVLEAIPDAVMVVGADFNVRWVNAAFSRLTGSTFSQAIGKRCYDVFKGDICRTPACPMTSIMSGEEILRFEADKHCACGRSAPGIMTARPLRSHRGELTGMIEIVSDMTPLYESRERFRKAMGGVIQAMSLTTEKRFPYTAGHQRRVTKICRIIAEEMGFSWDRTQGLRMAAAIHDFGKILIPAAILNKAGDMSAYEMGIIREHPQSAYDILKDVVFPGRWRRSFISITSAWTVPAIRRGLWAKRFSWRPVFWPLPTS